MIISNCVKNEDGSLNFDFHVTAEESAFLMDYAVKDLIYKGVLQTTITDSQQELDLFKDEGGQVN